MRKALELNDQLADAYAALGGVLQVRNERDPAREAFTRAIELNPNYSVAYNWLGMTYNESGEFEKALKIFHQGLEVDPLSVVLQSNIAYAAAAAGRPNELEAGSRRLVEIAPDSGFGYQGLAEYYGFFMGKVDDAILWMNRAVEVDQNEQRNMTNIASWYLDLDDRQSAKFWLISFAGRDSCLIGTPADVTLRHHAD